MVFLCVCEIANNVTFFLGKTGQRLQKRLVGVGKSFYHHWKDLSQLHGKSEPKISFSTDLLFVLARTKSK